jgi:hypothetical protein
MAFEARNPGTLFAELAEEDDAPTVTILGRETADFGPVVPMEEDYIAQFTGPTTSTASRRTSSSGSAEGLART